MPLEEEREIGFLYCTPKHNGPLTSNIDPMRLHTPLDGCCVCFSPNDYTLGFLALPLSIIRMLEWLRELSETCLSVYYKGH